MAATSAEIHRPGQPAKASFALVGSSLRRYMSPKHRQLRVASTVIAAATPSFPRRASAPAVPPPVGSPGRPVPSHNVQ